MKFSIIIPLYNKEKYIVETLNSIKMQTYDNYEVIIIDDSSTDNSLKLAQGFENDLRFHVYNIPNGGVSNARNLGMSKAKGDYICFLDADDIWKENYLEEASRLFNMYSEENVLCFGYKVFVGDKSNEIQSRNLSKFFNCSDKVVDFFYFSTLLKCSIALTSGVIIKRQFINEKKIYFNKKYSMGEDVDFWVRASAYGPIIYSNKCLMLYRSGEGENLTTKGFETINASYPYWEWYTIDANSNFKDKFTTRMLYSLALVGKKTHEYSEMRNVLSKIKGKSLFFNRLVLYICTYSESLLMLLNKIRFLKQLYYTSNSPRFIKYLRCGGGENRY